MPANSEIGVLINVTQEGISQASAQLAALQKQLLSVGKINISQALSTGQLASGATQQIALLGNMAKSGNAAAAAYASLKQQGSIFSKAFGENSRATLGQLTKTSTAFSTTYSRMGTELRSLQVVSDSATGSLRNLTAPERFNIMGSVVAARTQQIFNNFTTIGKQMQWVGRQMIVGMTLPIVTGAAAALHSFYLLNTAQTKLQKYLEQTTQDSQQAATIIKTQFAPAIEDIAKQTGVYADQVTNLAAEWTATGAALGDVIPLTRLTSQLVLLGQGEIDTATAMELVRTVQKTFNLSIAQTTDQIKQLTLVVGESALTMPDLVSALPLASTAASNFGFTVTELATSIAAMRDQGIQANAAANTLKFSINRLANPTTTATDKFDELTKSMKNVPSLNDIIFTASGEGRGTQAISDLADVFARLNHEEQLQLAGSLFGGYRADKMLKLFQEVHDKASQYNTVLQDTQNKEKALAVWTKQLNTIQESSAFQWTKLKTELALVAAKIGAEIVPYVQKLAQVIIDLLDKFTQAPASTKKFIVAMAAVLAAIGPITYAFAQLNLSIGALGKLLVARPLQSLFGLQAHQSATALQDLAARNPDNAFIQTMAGLPLSQEKFNTLATAGSQRILAEVASMGDLNASIEASIVLQTRLNEAMGRGLVPIAAEATAQKQSAIEGIVAQSGLSTKTNAITGKPMYFGPNPASPSGTSALKEPEFIARANALNASSAISNAITNVEKVGAETGTTTVKEFDVAATQAAANPNFLQSVKAKITGAFSRNSNTTAGSNLLGLLPGKSTASVVTAGEGAAPNTLTSLAFANPVKILLGIAAVAGALQHLPELSKGWADEQKQAGDIVASSFASLVNQVKDFFNISGKVTTVDDAWTALGDIIGKVMLSFAKLFAFVSRNIIPVLGGIGKAFATGIENTISAVSNLLNSFKKLGQGDFFGYALGALDALTLGFFHWNSEVGAGINILAKFAQIILAVFVGTRLIALVQGLVAGFTALSEIIGVVTAETTGFFGAIAGGISLIPGEMAAAETAAATAGEAFISPFTAIAVAVGIAIVAIEAFGNKTDEISKAISDNFSSISQGFDSIRQSAQETNKVFDTGTLQSYLSSIQSIGDAIGKVFGNIPVLTGDINTAVGRLLAPSPQMTFQPRVTGNAAYGTTPPINQATASALANKATLTPAQQNDIQLYGFSDRNGVHVTLQDVQAIKENEEARRAIDALIIGQDQKLVGLSKQQLLQLQDQLKAKLKGVQIDLAAAQAANAQRPGTISQTAVNQMKAEIVVINRQLALLGQSPAWKDAFDKNVGDGLTIAANKMTQWGDLNGQQAGDIGKKSGDAYTQAYQEALSSGLGTLNSNVEGAVTAAFDQAQQAQQDALDASQQDQLDALDKKQQEQSDQFDKNSTHKINAIQRDANAQTRAIDQQINEIQKQNDEEAWLQKQREYRQQREEMLRNQDLASAISYRERLKAILEGRFDDARLIELQQMQAQTDAAKQLKDLDAQHTQDVSQRSDDKEVARLNHQKDILTRQTDHAKKQLQRQLDQQKKAMQEQFDAQKKALQAQLDLQKKALQEKLDNEKSQLEAAFQQIDAFQIKNKKDWAAHYDEIQQIANKFGVSTNELAKMYMNKYGDTIKGSLSTTMKDAQKIAQGGAYATGYGAAQSFQQSQKAAVSPEDQKLYQVMHDFLVAQAKGAMTPGDLASWLEKIQSAMKGVSSQALQRVNPYVPSAQGGGGSIKLPKHSGGPINAMGAQQDVPITAQEGEYVIRRRAVKALGTDFMDQINATKEYHGGGFVGGDYGKFAAAAATSTYPAGAAAFADMGYIQGSVTRQAFQQMGLGMGLSIVKMIQDSQRTGIGGSVGMGTAPGQIAVFKGRGPFKVFPVAGPHQYSDDFGDARYAGGYHTHQGNDILSPRGTPIVAPFAGSSSKSFNTLGGNSAYVHGAGGDYVYNAHLDKYAQHYGRVRPGDLIGYVGNTGDAAGGPTHDHFEFHPHGGGAVDPFKYISSVDPDKQNHPVAIIGDKGGNHGSTHGGSASNQGGQGRAGHSHMGGLIGRKFHEGGLLTDPNKEGGLLAAVGLEHLIKGLSFTFAPFLQKIFGHLSGSKGGGGKGGGGGGKGGGRIGPHASYDRASPEVAKQLGRAELATWHHGALSTADAFRQMNYIVMHESSWKWNAAYDQNNPYAHAYGIPQANPGTKMATAGPDWKTNAQTQIEWMLKYIQSVYHTMQQAYNYKRAHGTYHMGGMIDENMPGLASGAFVKFDAPAQLHRGEMVLNRDQVKNMSEKFSGGGGESTNIDIDVNIDGNLIADDKSMKQLYLTLEQAGRKIAKQRGSNNVRIKVA